MSADAAIDVGVLGVGQMGRPMVERLTAAGWPTRVYVRRNDLAAELADAGVDTAESAVALASSVDVLVVCLFSDHQVREVVLDGGVLSAMHPGAVLVDHTTGSPDLVLELAERAPDGVRVVDMPVSGGAHDIAAGRLTVLAGGDPADIARARPIVSAYADPVIDVGALGDAMRVKLVNNVVFTVHLRVAIEAAKLAQSLGVVPAELARVLTHCSGDSYALRRLTGGGAPEQLGEAARPYLAKDIAAVRTIAADLELDLGLLGSLAEWVDDGTPLTVDRTACDPDAPIMARCSHPIARSAASAASSGVRVQLAAAALTRT